MGKIIDIKGQRFGKLVVLYNTGERRNRQVVWHCKCDCGNEVDVVGGSLRNGHTTSCGCKWKESKAEDLTGKKFNNLTVIERRGSDANRKALWYCKCDCGNFRTVTGSELRTGDVKACRECSAKNSAKYHTHEPADYSTTKWYQEIINHKFGRLIPIKPTEERNKAGRVIWECECDCGNPNHVFVTASSLKNGNTKSCGCLKHTSIQEEEINKILIKNNIPFQREYTFKDCLSPKEKPLRFDFAILNNDQTLSHLIEYDGIQHFEPIKYWGGKEAFEYNKICDEIKNNYCKQNNIPLIRLSYLQENNITIKDLLL